MPGSGEIGSADEKPRISHKLITHPRETDIYRAAFYLSCCPDWQAYEWLKVRPTEYSPCHGARAPLFGEGAAFHADVLDYILYRRKNRLIDLGLAEFGRSRRVLKRLYTHANKATRVTLCGNPSFYSRYSAACKNLRMILHDGSIDELATVSRCAHLTNDRYLELLKAGFGDDSISDLRFRRVIVELAFNTRMRTRFEATEYGKRLEENSYLRFAIAEMDYDKPFITAWQLADRVPVTTEWADALKLLFEGLVAVSTPLPDLQSTLERWRSPGLLVEHRSRDPIQHTDNGVGVREGLARLMEPTAAWLSSDDPALRYSYYSRGFPSFSKAKEQDWREWVNKDGEECVHRLMWNDSLWESEPTRRKLKELSEYVRTKYPKLAEFGDFRRRERIMRARNPAWFSDEGEAPVP